MFRISRKIAAGFLVLITLIGIAAPLVSPYDPNEQNLRASLASPSADHLLGTDKLGRDQLSRLMHGAQSTLLSAVIVVLLSLAAGIPLGLVSAYVRGPLDATLSRVFDVLLAVPALLLALLLVAVFGRGTQNAIMSLSIVYLPSIFRLTRSMSLVQIKALYVEAGKNFGFSGARILFSHIAPNVIPMVFVQASIDFAYAVLDLSALSFLGLGVQPPQADWGAMLADGKQYLLVAPGLTILPGATIMLTVIALNLVADAIQDRERPSTLKRSRPREFRTGRMVQAVAAVPNSAILEVRSLAVEFESQGRKALAVKDLSFKLERSESLAIVGESGSGKSAAALALVGLHDTLRTRVSGEILLEGEDLRLYSPRKLRSVRGSKISMIFQDPASGLNPLIRVGKQLEEALVLGGVERKMAAQKAVEMFRMARIPDAERRVKAYPHELSIGMQQRVLILVALAQNPKILIADEATTALDVSVQAQILSLIRELRASMGLTLLMISHDFAVLSGMCDRVLVMYAGTLVEEGILDDVLRKPAHPYTSALILAIPDGSGTNRPIRGEMPDATQAMNGCPFAPRCQHTLPICTEARPELRKHGESRRAACHRVGELELGGVQESGALT